MALVAVCWVLCRIGIFDIRQPQVLHHFFDVRDDLPLKS